LCIHNRHAQAFFQNESKEFGMFNLLLGMNVNCMTVCILVS